ncbi:hypothetical protein PVL29_009412 [Vitis rotundifolia]|uniref:Uncharacterized protein n=1 Tax=Vitis rotundifolia TaxID=103349 RepID=A0AA39DU26_VITRO|nr:hypothetical protein PVL29_009412 [Vitis rotundifolia]
MTSQISVEVVHDPSSRSVHTTSGVGRFVGRNHSPGQLVIASPGTHCLKFLWPKIPMRSATRTFPKTFMKAAPASIGMEDCALYLYYKMLQLALSHQFSSDMEKEFRIIRTS